MLRPRNGTGGARFGALLAAGALTVHQLRYLIADGGSASAALRDDGHAYLSAALIPLVVFALALVAGSLVRAALSASPSRRRPLAQYAIAFAAGLIAIFVAQETVEGLLASGHASGFTAAFAAGGWIALPLAVVIAIPLALIGVLLDRFETKLVEVAAARRPLPRAPIRRRRPGRTTAARPLAICNLAFGFARRPPPLLGR